MAGRHVVIGAVLMLIVSTAFGQHLDGTQHGPVPSSFFDLNIIGISKNTGWPRTEFHSWRTFHANWQDLQPTENKWDFARLDGDVQVALEHSVEPLLILQGVPQWADDMRDIVYSEGRAGYRSYPRNDALWTTYIRTVAERYRGKVRYYELWNEPENLRRLRTSPEALAHLNEIAYKILKSVDPAIVVVSSSLSSGDPVPGRPEAQLKQFAAAGVFRWSDVIGYHFYSIPRNGTRTPRLPENIVDEYKTLTTALAPDDRAKPVWCTEVGWYVSNDDDNSEKAPFYLGDPVSPNTGAAYLARTFILAWTLGIDRVYWYAWRHGYMGLTQFNGATKSTEAAYNAVHSWLLGSVIRTCDRAQDGTWQCALRRSDGTPAYIVWRESGAVGRTADPAWKVSRALTLDGRTISVSEKSPITISEAPVLLIGNANGRTK